MNRFELHNFILYLFIPQLDPAINEVYVEFNLK